MCACAHALIPRRAHRWRTSHSVEGKQKGLLNVKVGWRCGKASFFTASFATIFILNVNFHISKGITETSTQQRVTCVTMQLAKWKWNFPWKKVMNNRTLLSLTSSGVFKAIRNGNISWETHREVEGNETSDRYKAYFAQNRSLKFGYCLQQTCLSFMTELDPQEES